MFNSEKIVMKKMKLTKSNMILIAMLNNRIRATDEYPMKSMKWVDFRPENIPLTNRNTYQLFQNGFVEIRNGECVLTSWGQIIAESLKEQT
jgi:hypothetical protein